jgi:glycosyltransferase involved in cell wall biosynthesis
MEMAFGGKKKQWFRTLRYTFFTTWNCPLPYLADQVLENASISLKKIRRIPSGIAFQDHIEIDRLDARQELGWPTQGNIIGVVGRIDPKKRQDFVWEMFAMRPQENEYLVFVGSSTADEAPDFEEQLRLKIAAHPKGKNVIWAGFQNNMAAVYKATDVLIMPAINETFGMATLEAQQANCPVVGSNNGGTAALIELYGGGLTFEYDHLEDLSMKINELFKGAFPAVQTDLLKQHFRFERVCERIENEVLN